MSLGIRELPFRVKVSACVAGMLVEGAPRPRLEAAEGPEARIVADKIDRKLAPHDQLFEKGFAVAERRRCTVESRALWYAVRSGRNEDKVRVGWLLQFQDGCGRCHNCQDGRE